MAISADLAENLSLPVMVAPMFLVSGPQLACAAMDAGIIGSIPFSNARDDDTLANWLQLANTHSSQLAATKQRRGIWAANVVTHRSNNRLPDWLPLLRSFQPPIAISALGGPAPLIDAVHSYGGMVWADVNSIRFARKAIDQGADGLILVCSGAGGHTGFLNPFSFINEVRRFFSGPVAVGGGIATGRNISALQAAGADIANMGTAFIATEESSAPPLYKQMLIEATIDDLVLTDAVTGVKAYWLRESLIKEGMDPDALEETSQSLDFSHGNQAEIRRQRWRKIWSAGQGVGQIDKIQSVADLVGELSRQYHTAMAACN